jgi:hypothetical protein
MKKHLVMACLLGFAIPALAGGNSNSNNSDTITNYGDTVTNNQGGAGGQGGTGVGVGIAGAYSGSNSTANSSNTNLNLQGQQQSTSNSNNAAQSTNVIVQGDTYKQERPAVNTAYAPTIFPTAPCMGSSSVGASGSLFSISGGSTWTSNECMILETARAFDQAGYKTDGLYIRCQGKYAAAAPSCKALKETEGKGTPVVTTNSTNYDVTDAFVKSNFLGINY